MISKEQIPAVTPTPAASEPDPAELPDGLKQALQNAYPNPNGRIAAKVMEQIRMEQQPTLRQPKSHPQTAAERRSEKAERRRHRHGLIMKYGGMAACMVILSGALVLASPLMDRTADEAAMADQSVLTAACDYADEPAPAAVYSTSLKSITADADAAVNDSIPTEVLTEAEEEVPMMLFSTRLADPIPEEAEPAAANSILADAAAEAACDAAEDNAGTVSPKEAFLQYLITEGYLTAEEFARWQSTLENADAWTTDSLCEAFLLDETLYDTWLKK